MAHILIVEDDRTFSNLLKNFLQKHTHTTVIAPSVKEADDLIRKEIFDVVLLDYRLPDGTGMDLLNTLKSEHSSLSVIVMTSFHDIRIAVKTVRSGAYDYITKPINPEELLMILQEAIHSKEEKKQKAAATSATAQFVEGISNAARQIQEYVKLVAPTELSLIIQGESGSGKELVAQTIHALSKRSNAPFIAIDCGALSTELAGSELFGYIKGAFTGALQNKKGQFELANGGTLFLDEIGNLSYEVQVKLLRALQERVIQPIGSVQPVKVNVRIIAATNDDLLASVKAGTFREDLYHRLNEFKIKLPSLKEREDDLESFIAFFIRQANHELNKKVNAIADDVRKLFYKYDWPGNLRELKNIIKRAVLLAKNNIITLQDLPPEMNLTVDQEMTSPGADLKAVQAVNERALILKTLQEVRYNKSKAAKILNIDRTTLYYKMAKYQIEH